MFLYDPQLMRQLGHLKITIITKKDETTTGQVKRQGNT
jgi:hypothetical protein